jgi:trehalose-6-phosphatase
MTVDERDQWECLLADWSASYGFSISDDETDEHAFKAAPHAATGAVLEAADPRLLRAKVAEDHARRAAAALQEGQ